MTIYTWARAVMVVGVCVMGMVCGGCASLGWPTTYSRYAVDTQKDQPWVNEKERAQAFVSMIDSWGGYRKWLEWTDAKKRLVATSDSAIRRSNEWVRNHPSIDRIEEVVVTDPRYAASGATVPVKEAGYKDVRVIVCVRPLVVVMGPGPVAYSQFEGPYHGEGLQKATVKLGSGFDYGTEVPFAAEAIWFSPEMKVGPQPAEVVDENTRRIRVTWGSLYLRREGEKWMVTTGK